VEVQAQQTTVHGTVKDAESGNTLPGVNISVKGTTTGTSTDADGAFELTVPSASDTLRFSYIGYQTKNVPINGRTTINVTMKPTVFSGKQLVVVGYGEQKKENLTGSVSSISSKGIELQSVNNTAKALRGLAPGLDIGITSQGGELDAPVNINIRGAGSISGSNPYILIDGVRASERELASLNPNDIKNVSVLKGAAASAIYGSHAAFGAILVTTKSGEEDQPFTVNYSTNIRLKSLIFVPPTVSSIQYAEVYNTAAKNFSGQTAIGKDQISKMRKFINGDLKNATAPNPDNNNYWLGVGSGHTTNRFAGYANTDWFDVMYKNMEVTQKHNISIRGGTDKITYYVSGNYLLDPGQLRYGDKNEYYKKYNLNSNVSANITDWLKFTDIFRYSQTHNSFPGSLDFGTRGRFYHDVMRFAPFAPYKTPPVKDEQGNIIVPAQLVQMAGLLENNGFNKYSINNLVNTLKASLDITNSVNIKGDFSFKRRFYNQVINLKKWSVIGPDGSPSLTHFLNNNQIRRSEKRTNYYSFNIYGNYKKTFYDNHNLNVLVGYQQENNLVDSLSIGRLNVIAPNLNTINVATGDFVGAANPLRSFATIGAFGRVQYNYKQKYLFEFNGRYDGSSRFAPHHRFVFSPSFSAGYNISKESFWSPIRNIISNLKIRGSWGKLGNQDVNSNLYLSTIPIHTKLNWIINGIRPVYTSIPAITSPNITWETVTSKNIGLDFGFLNNRLTGKVDIYERDTDNMFGPISAIPVVLGASPPKTNSASLRTRGWGLSLGWQDQVKKDLSYNIKVMVYDNQSTITKYNNSTKSLGDYYVGEKLGEIWGYKTDGLFQTKEEVENYLSKVDATYLGTNWQPGDVKYRDLNGNGKIDIGDNTADNPGDRRIIGNSHPRYHFSIQAGASWKGLSLSMLWQGIAKRDAWLNAGSSVFWGWTRTGHTHITPYTYHHFWSEDNKKGYLPIQLDGLGKEGYGKDRNPTDRYLQNGAYIRLKSIQLSYTLPESLINKLKLKGLTVFVNGQNLLTITPMWPNIDPELAIPKGFRQNFADLAYPLARTYGFGINISL
jgi:TonB-linked SusC/RagA family outer membrane protein